MAGMVHFQITTCSGCQTRVDTLVVRLGRDHLPVGWSHGLSKEGLEQAFCFNCVAYSDQLVARLWTAALINPRNQSYPL